MVSSGIDPAAIATEVKLGRMFKENAPTKAMRYLVEGRIYTVEHAPGRGWSCTCPARGRCAHRLAVAHVVARADQ
jgi:hypothetical protein